MFNFNLRFPFPSFFSLDRYRFSLILPSWLRAYFLSFFLDSYRFFIFSRSLSWSKGCFLSLVPTTPGNLKNPQNYTCPLMHVWDTECEHFNYCKA